MKEPRWISETECYVGDIRFTCLVEDHLAETTDEHHLVLIKTKDLIARMLDLFRRHNIRRAFEFGIFQGGSVLLWTEALELERMAALDIRQPLAPLDAFIHKHGLSDRIRLTYGVSQDDPARVEEALAASFAPGDIDLIIDDASHQYELTRSSFEIAFPYLSRGGLYVIEDWAWAHWRSGNWQSEQAPWRDQPALSNLIFELVMATASSRLFSEVIVWNGVVIAKKSQVAPVGTPLSLADAYSSRGKTLPLI